MAQTLDQLNQQIEKETRQFDAQRRAHKEKLAAIIAERDARAVEESLAAKLAGMSDREKELLHTIGVQSTPSAAQVGKIKTSAR